MVRTHKLADAAHGRHLAHFGHGGQAAGELANDLFLVAAQHVDADFWRAKLDAQSAKMAHFVHHGGHVQERLAGDAADVQAHAAKLGVALHQYDLEAQVGSAKRRRIAAGVGAQHEQVTVQINRAGEAGGIGCGCALSNRARG